MLLKMYSHFQILSWRFIGLWENVGSGSSLNKFFKVFRRFHEVSPSSISTTLCVHLWCPMVSSSLIILVGVDCQKTPTRLQANKKYYCSILTLIKMRATFIPVSTLIIPICSQPISKHIKHVKEVISEFIVYAKTKLK